MKLDADSSNCCSSRTCISFLGWKGAFFKVHVSKEVKIVFFILGTLQKEGHMRRGNDYGKWYREFCIPTRQYSH